MDSFSLVCSGHAGRIQGLGKDRKSGAPVYRFSLAVNFPLNPEPLWLQCTVADPLLNLVLERGILTGDHLLVTVDNASINAMVDGGKAKSWLNCRVHQIVFLTAPAVPQIEHAQDFNDRHGTIIDYTQLMKQKVSA